MDLKNIIVQLPYQKPFLFVDKLLEVNGDGAKGTFRFSENSDFYRGHFKGNPVTPGVILTECCAQIGLVCLGIFLLNQENLPERGGPRNDKDTSIKVARPNEEPWSRNVDKPMKDLQIGLSSSQMEFLLPVFPRETVTVTSEKLYFRFNKLKCKVKMHNASGKLVCKGEIAGMIEPGTY